MLECKRFVPAAEWESARGADDWEKAQDFLVEGYAMSQRGHTVEIRSRALSILNAIAAAVDKDIRNDPLACLMSLADSGAIDKIKQAALYLDIDAEGSIGSNPMTISECEAKFWVDIAAVAVASLTSCEAVEAAAGEFRRLYGVTSILPASALRQPSAGEWRKLVGWL